MVSSATTCTEVAASPPRLRTSNGTRQTSPTRSAGPERRARTSAGPESPSAQLARITAATAAISARATPKVHHSAAVRGGRSAAPAASYGERPAAPPIVAGRPRTTV